MNTKRLLSTLMILIVTVSLLLAACAPTVPVTDSKDPVTVVKNFYEILNTKNIDKAMSLTAEDYVMNDPFGTYDQAGAAIQWQAVVDAGLTFNQTNFVDTGNGRVTSCYEVFENGKSIDKGCGNVTHVRDGKIIYDGLEPAEQIWIVQKFYERLNAQNVEEAMSLTAEDYVMNDPFGTYDRAGAATQWQAVVDAGLSFNQTNFVNTGDGRVTSCYEVFENGTSIDKGCGNVTHVRDGKIIFDGLLPAEQVWIAQKHYEAINTGNLDAAMMFVAEDVQCRGTCYLNGKESYQFLVQGFINIGGRTELSDFVVDGDKVTYNWIGYNQNGAVSAGGSEFMQIKDGKILLIESDLN
jgi:ketosteroid isomerase-like protein